MSIECEKHGEVSTVYGTEECLFCLSEALDAAEIENGD